MEKIVKLSKGYTVRSSSNDYVSGDYVRICNPEGKEIIYWHYEEWANEPVRIMGSIINCMAAPDKIYHKLC